ncbi:hypothetical protein V6Z11_A03G134800 [Gossypium hirsutum]
MKSKSNIFFSKITPSDVRIQITQMFGFQKVQNLGKYLGVPFFHERVTKNTPSFIVDKVRQKLQSWDARMLSMAGRIILAQSVLLSIPNFFIQSMMIPGGVCSDIEKLVRHFIWGHTEGNSKMSSVGWDSICQPRAKGGLGFRNLDDQNKSFLMKIDLVLFPRVMPFGFVSFDPNTVGKNNYHIQLVGINAPTYEELSIRYGYYFVKT